MLSFFAIQADISIASPSRFQLMFSCTVDSKINVTPKSIDLPISKLHSILAVANLLAHNIL